MYGSLSVALTDGVSTRIAMWIRRGNTGAHAGTPSGDWHASYHDDGRIHTKHYGQYEGIVQHHPIAEVGKPHCMLSIHMDESFFRGLARQRQPRPAKGWGALLDVRRFPDGCNLSVHAGVVANGCVEQLAEQFGPGYIVNRNTSPVIFLGYRLIDRQSFNAAVDEAVAAGNR